MVPPNDELDYSVLPNKEAARTARKAKGLTQESLVEAAAAKKMDISKRTVENIEGGKRVMKSSLSTYAQVVDVDLLIAAASEVVPFTQEMLEAIPLPVFFKDSTGRYRGCNERFCRYLGRDREHIIGKTVFEVAPTAHAKVYKAKDDDLFATPGEQVYQARVVANTVERRVVFFKGTFPVSGAPEGIIGVIVDITDYTSETPELIDPKTDPPSVLIADSENHRILRYSSSNNGRLEVVAGTGKKGKSLGDGDPLKCELAQPHGVAVHPKTGDIYIADSTNGRILKITR